MRDSEALDRIFQAMTAMLMHDLNEREAFAEIAVALEGTGRRLLDEAGPPANDNALARSTGR